MSGPAVQAAEVTVGMTLPPLSVRLSRTGLVRYAGASGDFNPIHHSEHFAARVGLPGVVAHGLLTMGTALRVVTDWVGDPGRVRSYSCRFTKPVVVPDDGVGAELQITGTVSAVQGDLVTVSLEVVSAGEKVLGAARAQVDLSEVGRGG